MPSLSFFWKLYGTYVVVVVLCAVLVAVLVNRFYIDRAYSNLNASMELAAEMLASLEAANPSELWTPIVKGRVDELTRNTGMDFDVILADGRAVASSRTNELDGPAMLRLPEFAEAAQVGMGSARRGIEADERLYLVRPIKVRSESIGYVRVSAQVEPLRAESTSLTMKIAWGASAAAAISLVLGIYFTRTVTRPLNRIKSGCLAISQGELDCRIELPRRDEFGIVAATVDKMADSLSKQVQSMQQQRNRLQLVLRLLNEAVIAIEANGTIAFCNLSAQRYCARPRAECVGLRFDAVLQPDRLRDAIARGLAGQAEVEQEISWEADGGREEFVSLYLAPMSSEQHDILGMLAVVRDISEGKRFEALRRDFASNVSHELKTPITAISTLLDALEQGAKNDPHARDAFLDRVRLQSQRMHRLVEELLALSKLESGQGLLDLREFDARRAFTLAIDTFKPMADFREVRFKCQLPAAPVMVKGDIRAVEVMINSLIDNALKFTPPHGLIEANLSQRDGVACIEVIDTGTGIARRHLERVFERFYRTDASRARDRGGSGLGLAIVKHLSSAHGGTVSAHSVEGKGSRFTVSLPLALGDDGN